jgi:hypothetical protein
MLLSAAGWRDLCSRPQARIQCAGQRCLRGWCRRHSCHKTGDQGLSNAHKSDTAPHPTPALGLSPGGAVPGSRPAALWHHLC